MSDTLFKSVLRHRFGLLLILQGAMLMTAAFAQKTLFEEEIFTLALLGVLGAGGLSILRDTHHKTLFMLAGGLTFLANVVAYFTSVALPDMVAYGMDLLFMVWVLYVMASVVLFGREATGNVALGAACIYIHIGMVFAFVYQIIEALIPQSFYNPYMAMAGGEVGHFLGYLLYYSYVTLGTVGYGDIIPVTPEARYFSVIETITGQLYLAIVVARLVGLPNVLKKNS